MLNKNIFVFILLGVFIINFSSAGLFDPGSELAFHEEGKNGKYGYYEINDTDFWFFNNKPVKTIELLENEYSVFTAWNIKEIEVFRPSKLFDKTNYLDKEQKDDRSNLISSELHFYREWKIKTRIINNQSCITYETSVNQTQVCSEWEDNYYQEEYEGWSDWQVYNFQTVQEGLYQTKTIVTRNSQNTGTIDWVDENEGHNLDEWATWWDNDWTRKRQITNLDGDISALYVINFSSSMKSDFSDLRFLDTATENIELNYTIVIRNNGVNVSIRVNNLGNSSIYMYYGNPAVSTTGSAEDTFLLPDAGYFYDNQDARDFTSNGNNGTITGASFTSSGYIGGAYDIQAGDEIDLINAILPTSSNAPFSIVNWVKITNTADSQRGMVSQYQTGGGVGRMFFDIQSDEKARLFINGNSVSATNAIPTGSFQCVAVTRNSSGFVKHYLNGATNGGGALGDAIQNTETKIGEVNGANQLKGISDEVYLYTRELSATEVANLCNQTTPSFIVGPEQISIGVSTTLISPENDENILNNTVSFSFTSIPTQTNLTNATLYIWWNNGTLVDTNFTTLSGNESVNTTLINTLADGMWIWNAETCGENVNCSFDSSNNSFIVHVTPITINMFEPNATIPYILLGDNQTLTWQLTEPGENLTEHVTNCSFTYDSVITYLPLSTCVGTNTTNFTYIYGVNNLTFNTTDQFNLTSNKTTIWEYTIVEINQTFEENITEGALNDFSLLLNISESSSLTDATFSYNGTNYTTTIVFSSGLYLISSLIVSPTVDTNTNFSFNFFFTVDGTNYSTSVNEQLVVNSLFDICGGLSNDTLLNMSLVDEKTGLGINGTIEIVADIVSQSSGVTVGTINGTFADIQHGAICFSPVSSYPLYYLNTEIKYFSDGYVSELYYIQNSDMTDYPRNLTLFDLNQTDSTEFVVTFQNDAFVLVEGAIIQLQRKYIGENVYKVVEAPITSDGGKAIVHIDLNTNIYRASIVKDGVLLKFFDDIVFSCDNELAGECEEQLRGDVDPNNDVPVEDLIDFSYSVSVSEANNTITTLFAVPSGTPSSINVLLEQKDMFGNVTACNTTVITSAGSITCDFSDTIEKSILQLTISKDGTQLAITNYGVDPELDMDGMNFFIVFLFLISLVGMAISSPEWMMIIGIMVFMISGTLLLLKGMSLAMGLGAMAWLVVAVIIIILKMAKQEDR